MISFPNAKINIGLRIVSRREDGYHNIESVFHPLPLKDILEITPRSDQKCELKISGISIPGSTEENICFKAFQCLQQIDPQIGADIHLHKIIPTGAGLGGGSADGSFTLTQLIDLFELEVNKHDLHEMVLSLGSDCPYFLHNQSALVTGRGEIIQPIDLSLKDFHFILVHPGIHIPTKEAYAGIVLNDESSDPHAGEVPIEEWRERLINDFEPGIFKAYPEISRIKQRLYDLGAIYAQMSGSGSAVYGIFRELPTAEWPEQFKVWAGSF